MKTAVCKISFDGYDWKNELKIISPSGTSRTLSCNGKWDKMSKELKELAVMAQNVPWGVEQDVEVSYSVMEESLTLCLNWSEGERP